MLPKSHRLPSSDISHLMRTGRRVSVPNFQIIFQKTNLTISRFAVVVSTRIDKRSTKRNRAKRLIHESIQHLVSKIAGGWDIVFHLRSTLGGMLQPKVELLVKDALMRTGVLEP